MLVTTPKRAVLVTSVTHGVVDRHTKSMQLFDIRLPRIWSHFVNLTLTSQRLEAGHCGISRRGGVDEIDWDLVLMEYLLR